jgi:uncharacterized glyoxalase superfamily protein PhnB
MKPKDWPQLSSALFYADPHGAIAWLCRAFGFEVRIKVESPDGGVEHSELTYGEALVMVGAQQRATHRRSPEAVGGFNTQSLLIYVEDVDSHYLKARANGASIVKEPTTTDYGKDHWTDRGYEAIDPEGHHWWFVERLRNPSR